MYLYNDYMYNNYLYNNYMYTLGASWNQSFSFKTIIPILFILYMYVNV